MTTAPAVAAAPVTPPAARPHRVAEIALLVPALAIGLGAYAQASLALLGRMPDHFPAVTAVALVLAAVAHLATRLLAPYADQVLLPTVVALNGLGLAMIYRLDLADQVKALRRGQPAPTWVSLNQLGWTALGVALLVTVLLVVRDVRRMQRLTYTLALVGLALLVLPLVPGLGVTINGARIWIRLAGLSFQPAEIAKLALIAFFAGYLVVTRDALAVARTRVAGIDLPRGRDLGPILVAWLVSLAVLVFEKDLGTSLLFFGVFVAMLYVATGRRGWVVIGTLLFLAGSFLAYRLFGHVQTRIDVWLHPFADPGNRGYQITQSLYGLADGGLLGRGIGQGTPDLVPYAKSDFIVSAIGEELGLAGLMAVLVLYGVIVERGLRIGLGARDAYGRLLAVGLGFVVGLQVFIVVGGVTGLIPLTGLTTPFLSAGGSSMVANWVLIALLLRISDQANRPAPTVAPPMDDAQTQVVRL